jgi:hypothetical protein
VPGPVLANPVLDLYDGNANLITSNDDWQMAANKNSIPANLRPPISTESAIFTTLAPGSYTVVLRGLNNGTGIGLVDVNDLDTAGDSRLSNISTRGFVENGAKSIIAGTIVHGPGAENILFRALGPTLAALNVPNVLADPFLDLRDTNGVRIASNSNWKDTQQAEIQATRFAPPNDTESAIAVTLQPGNYTAILSGENGTTGNGLVEVYALP